MARAIDRNTFEVMPT